MFSLSHLEEVAKITGFMKNKSKLRPDMFLDFLFFKNVDDSKSSLTDFVTSIKLRYGQDVRKQSIDDRFTEKAVNFIKKLVSEQLSSQLSSDIEGLSHFSRVKIKDSTRFQLPEHLQEDYPGSGGGASKAGVHIQFEYDFLAGQISDLSVSHAKRQDVTDASETMETVQKGELIIRDLGYFVQKVFKHVIEQEAYFISRVRPNVCLYALSGEQIDLKKLYASMKKRGIDRTEILITTKQIKTPLRLIVETLPEAVLNQRLAKAKKEAKKNGSQLSEQYKAYAALNLFITNVKEETLSTQAVSKLYHLRWQIELRFKAWKSFCLLHKTKKMKKHRFECQLYAKLLYILLTWEMGYHFQVLCWNNKGKLISLHKFYKMCVDLLYEFRHSLYKGEQALKDYLKDLYLLSRENLLSEHKKNKLSLADLIPLIVDNQ